MQKQGSMPRHSGTNAPAFILAESSMPQHSVTNAAAFKQEGKIWVLAEAPMPRHSSFNAAALTLRKKKCRKSVCPMLRHSQPNAAAFTSHEKKNFGDRTFNAAALSAQCRGIHTRTQNLSESPRPQCRSIQYRMPRHSKPDSEK